MKTLNVDLGSRSYPINIGPLFSSPELLLETVNHQEVLIVSNETVAPLYLETISKPLQSANKKVGVVILPDGEKYKTLETVNLIFNELLAKSFSRKVLLIALGGGVVGDMTGFAAASYQRGVDFLQIPTTLLSQVDSSVGGKTGVNHPLGKNMIGAFKQPIAVFIDPVSLTTLPTVEFAAGFAEVIKHGVIQSKDYLSMLERNFDAIFQLDPAALTEVIVGSCEIKASVVSQDETEQGIRAILNLGHTFGHAIETAVGYGNWLHGNAVAVGMLMAASLSAKMGHISKLELDRLEALLVKSKLPVTVPRIMTKETFLQGMYRDKKVDSGTLKLVLIKQMGDAYITSQFSATLLDEVIDEFCAAAAEK